MRVRVDPEFARLKKRCYSACLWKKTGGLGENREANLERISEIFHILDSPEEAENAMKIISACLEKVANIEDKCDFAEALDECTRDK